MTPLVVNWDPNTIAFNLFGIPIAWYGIMWSCAIAVALYLWYKIIKREGLEPRMIESGFFHVVLGTVIGARLGHCLFYEPAEYFLHPFMSEFPWIKLLDFRGGGMASHGAAIGMVIGVWLFCRKWKVPMIWMFDRMSVMVPLGGALVRFGNLINSEVYGVPTDGTWGFIFKGAGETVPMHPTQLYEAVCYLVIFLVMAHLYWRTKVPDRRGVMFGLFLILLFAARFIIEFWKMPQESFEVGWALNMGQWLSIPFILAGAVILVYGLRRPPRPYTDMPKEKVAKYKKKK